MIDLVVVLIAGVAIGFITAAVVLIFLATKGY
jgi:tetrahydromethanopterin S-methyltransferase subunit F